MDFNDIVKADRQINKNSYRDLPKEKGIEKRGMKMKYFEVNYPYYALIKAENTKEATKAYIDSVAGDEVERPIFEETLKEVSRDYALIKFSKSPGEDGKPVSILETMQDFNSEKNDVLLIDGSLL